MKTKILIVATLILVGWTSGFSQDKVEKMTTKEAVKTGVTAPDFALTDQDGKQIKLSEAVKKSKVVIVFYRGYW